jgi:predicted PurR-regulated permease PerM
LPGGARGDARGGARAGAAGDSSAVDSTGSAPSGGANVEASTVEASSGGASSGGASSSGGGLGGARRAASTLVTGLGELLLALAFCALGLAEAEAARGRLARALPPDLDPPVLDTVDEATRAFRRYALVKTLTSAITGVASWLAALAFGLPLAWVWGLLAFLLEYVPSVGSVLAVVPPTLMALAVDGPSRALLVFLGIGTLQVILGNVLDPRLEGRYMAVSPFVVLLSIVLWGWLWGPVGALLAVPMTVAVVIAARHIPGARGLATLVRDDDADDAESARASSHG